MRERLMLNHIICLFNVFGYKPCMRMLEFKIKDEQHWSSIKTMLLYLDLIEEWVDRLSHRRETCNKTKRTVVIQIA